MSVFAEVIGDPIGHSRSPLIHSFWLDRLGLRGTYAATQVPRGGLAGYLAARREDPDWRGCNVTLPHKQAIVPLLDALDPVAAKIGAVNTVVDDHGRLVGHNSDAAGFLRPLAPWLGERHLLRTARILGAGGAARAIAHGLWSEGFTLVIAAREPLAAAELASGFDPGHVHTATLAAFARPLGPFDWGDAEGRLDLVVNATPLGMAGMPPLALDFSNVPPGAIVYDAVYAPVETPLVAAARARGHPVIDGLAMLVGQARIAFRLLFGAEPPDDPVADAALRARLLES